MTGSGSRRTLGMVFLSAAGIAAAVCLYTLLFADNRPVGSYVALTVVLTGTAVIIFTTNGGDGESREE